MIAIICYIIANVLICMTPRPDPCFNLCKKPPVKKKKKKKKKKDPEQDELNPGYDPDNPDAFYDEDEGYVDPYAEDDDDYYDEGDEGEYDDAGGDNTMGDDDVYNDDPEGYDEAIGYDEDEDEDDTYAAETFDGDAQEVQSSQMTDGGWSSGEEDSQETSGQYA